MIDLEGKRRGFKKVVVMATRLVLAAVLLCNAATAVSAGKIYKWRDEKGQLHFTDSEANIPAEYRSGVSETKFGSTPPAVRSSSPPASKATVRRQSGGDRKEEDGFTIPYVAREGSANRVIIDMVFNGRVTAPILVDTGSPGLVISAGLANRLGLLSESAGNLLVTIGGIGGSEPAIRTIMDKVRIGSITEEFIPTHIVREMADAYQGLVGMDILSKYSVTIDSARQRLIARRNPESGQLPAGRNRHWWETNFREFNYYSDFWESQLKAVNDSGGPYSRLSTSRREEIKEFIEYQRRESKNLLTKLDRYARWNSVPRHWRR